MVLAFALQDACAPFFENYKACVKEEKDAASKVRPEELLVLWLSRHNPLTQSVHPYTRAPPAPFPSAPPSAL